MKNKFQPRLFLFLALGFIVATAAGTLSHEGGHYIAARIMGYDGQIHYGSISYSDRRPAPEIERIVQTYRREIISGQDYPGKEQYDSYQAKFDKSLFWMTLGGPLQTMLFGTAGLLALFRNRKKYTQAVRLSFGRWLLIFLSLFWLRQPANCAVWLISGFCSGHFSTHGDEIRLALNLGLPQGLFTIGTALAGSAALAIVLFRFIPRSTRLTFIAAGLAGGVCGYFLWMEALGPLLL